MLQFKCIVLVYKGFFLNTIYIYTFVGKTYLEKKKKCFEQNSSVQLLSFIICSRVESLYIVISTRWILTPYFSTYKHKVFKGSENNDEKMW